MPCYAAPETIDGLRRAFPYITDRADTNGLFRPMIEFTPVEGRFRIGDVSILPLPVEHGPRTNGYLMECGGARLAYISDCSAIPETTLEAMGAVEVLVLDCLRERFHPTHLNREAALRYVERIRPRRTFFVHMCHDVKHADFEAGLPDGVRLAYDGLAVEVKGDGDVHA